MFVRWLISLFLGCSVILADEVALVRVGEPWSLFKGFSEPSNPLEEWRQVSFDDSSWGEARSGFSFGYGGFDEATPLTDMPGNYASLYLRKHFALTNVDAVKWLILRVDYAGGYVAYINGQEVARRGFGGAADRPILHSEAALSSVRAGSEDIDISPFIGRLREGDNVLAIQAHTAGPNAFSFAVIPELLANFTRGPFIQNLTSNSVQIIWRTLVPTDGRVDYGVGESLGLYADSAPMVTNHVVTLTNLTPATRYFYRVTSGADDRQAVSSVQPFETLKMAGDIEFMVFGDSGSGSLGQMRIAEVLRSHSPQLVMHVGDVIYPEFTTNRTDLKCHSVYRPQMRTTPYFFIMGNHDLYAGDGPFLDAFYLPTNSVTGTEHYYSFDHGDAHFAILYVPYLSQYVPQAGDTQQKWLEADLAASSKPWKFIFMHNPAQTSSAHRFDDQNFNGVQDRFEIKDYVLPLASKYGVQMIFSGHEHCFERFNPTNGVHTVTTGGGGIWLYPLIQLDVASSQFWMTHNCVSVSVRGDTLELSALDQFGATFDTMSIQRATPPAVPLPSAWFSPSVETGQANDGDGNITGQTFNLLGEARHALAGQFSNLGRVQVNNDATNLYIGFSETMIYGDADVLLFVETPRLNGVAAMHNQTGVPDFAGDGAGALQFLGNLSFTNFSPAVACILGDEFADGQYRSFSRPGMAWNSGQGVYYLRYGLPDVPDVHLQQFHRSPQAGLSFGEQNANFIELSVPLAALGNLRPGDTIKLGAVVGAGPLETNNPARARVLDKGFLGVSLTGAGAGPVVLEGVAVQLAKDPNDADGDGLSAEEEITAGTNPANPDTDGDGLPDGWEVAHGLNPLSGAGMDGADGDPDGDGLSNIKELRAGTDPRDAASALRLAVQDEAEHGLHFRWPAVPGRIYQLEVSDRVDGNFTNVNAPGFPRITSRAVEECFLNRPADGLNTTSRFYRLRLVPE